MWNLLKAELLKLRRCQILWVGLVALALCPLVQYGSQLIVEAEYRNPNYDFSTLFENVVWGNTQMFFPISLVMIGSWLIDRESTHDTLKNIMTIPVSMPKMLGAKLFWVGIFAVLLGIYSVGVTLITGLTVGLSGLTVEVFFHGGTQIVLAALTTYLVCMPLILIFGQIRGAYLGGSILAFFLGYSMLFFKGGILASIYPFSRCAGPGGLRSERICREDRGSGSWGWPPPGSALWSSGQGCCFCGPQEKRDASSQAGQCQWGRREGLRRCKGLRPVGFRRLFFQDLWVCRSTRSSFFILTHRTNVRIIRTEHTFFFETGDGTADRTLCV